jgi:spermidine/putrescine transport system ATP-binding protein
MRTELVQLQRSLGITFILVTHDLEEAIECSSRIAVMREGRIAQYAEQQHIFRTAERRLRARLWAWRTFSTAGWSRDTEPAGSIWASPRWNRAGSGRRPGDGGRARRAHPLVAPGH